MLTGLAADATDAAVRTFLHGAGCGSVEVFIPTDAGGEGKGRGVAFVSVAGDEAYRKLLAFSGAEHNGNAIAIKEAREAPGGATLAPSVPEGISKLFVANLSFKVTEEALRSAFSGCGTVTAVRLGYLKDDPSKLAGWAHVEFETRAEAEKGVALNGTDLLGRSIRVESAVPSVPSGGGGGAHGGGGGGGGFGGGGGGGFGSGRGGRGGTPASGRGTGGRGGGRGTPNTGRARGSGSIQVRATLLRRASLRTCAVCESVACGESARTGQRVARARARCRAAQRTCTTIPFAPLTLSLASVCRRVCPACLTPVRCRSSRARR
jgi:hypothetical protein